MAQRMSIVRIVCSGLAAGLLVGAMYFAFEYRRADCEFYEWVDARPVKIAVDLSRSGTLTVPFHQTCDISHGEVFYMNVPRLPDGDSYHTGLLQGLDGTITINDDDGKEIKSLKMVSGAYDPGCLDGPIVLASCYPFPTGNYTVTIDVQSGAPALAGIKQTIHAQYRFCGLERFPAVIAGFLVFACGIPGLILGIIVVRGFVRHGLSARKSGE